MLTETLYCLLYLLKSRVFCGVPLHVNGRVTAYRDTVLLYLCFVGNFFVLLAFMGLQFKLRILTYEDLLKITEVESKV